MCAYLRYLQVPVDTVLDLGCGVGLWKGVVERYFPEVSYHGVEISDAACERYGWEKGSVVDYVPMEPADFVICQGVLQYLEDAEAERAMANLVEVTEQVLFLEALTKSDWEENVSQELTDGAVHLRSGDWYRKRLHPAFIACGGGVFVKRDADIVLYELERA